MHKFCQEEQIKIMFIMICGGFLLKYSLIQASSQCGVVL